MDITKEMAETAQKDNIWDRTFKVMLLRCPRLFLPLIETVFQMKYDERDITLLNNEYYNEDGSKMISDTVLLIKDMTYHFECQFTNDKEMAFRMFGYDFQIGLSDSKRVGTLTEVNFPKSCVVYITVNDKNPKELELKVNFQDGFYNYKVPAIRVKDYPIEKIDDADLFIFLPYMVLKFSQRVKNKVPPSKEEILCSFQEELDLLDRAYKDNRITNLEYNVLLGLIKETEQHALKDCEEIKKEVTDMVANLIDLKCLKIYDEATEKAEIDMLKRMKQSGATEEVIRKTAQMSQIPQSKVDEILNG